MKKTIGFIALGIMGLTLLAWILLVTTASSFLFKNKGIIALVFILLFGSLATAIACLAGEVVKYFGRKNAEGYRSVFPPEKQYQQPNNPQQSNQEAGQGQGNFCPHCGAPATSGAAFCRNCGNKL